ncbi:MAG: nucleoside recognition domain-containing protein [Acutalibacteraceae bacterium]
MLKEIHLKLKKKKPHFQAAKIVLFTFVVFAAAFSILEFPEEAGKGAYDGIELCLKNVIPSLFPFMVVSCVFIQSGISEKVSAFFEPVTRFLFRQPGNSFCVILLSQIGGFPIGASLVKRLFESKKLSPNQARRLMLFCINPGPGFVIGYVGSSLLGSRSAGVVIYCSVVLSSLFLGILSRFVSDGNDYERLKSAEEEKEKGNINISAGLIVESVKKSTFSIAVICGWVVIFSCFSKLVDLADFSDEAKVFISAFLEVTNGCKQISLSYAPSLVAGAIGWSGLCIHFQIMDAVIMTGLKLKYFLTARITNAAFATVICEILFKIFPACKPVAVVTNSNVSASASGISVSHCLLAMCLLMLIGDSVIISKKKQKYERRF